MPEDVFTIVGTTQGGSFRVERAVAEGGFSVIYRAQHGASRAPVALKCLKVPGDLTAQERAAYLEKFREEAELLFRLSASIPEVVRPLHVDTLNLRDGRFVPFLALEWLEGETLDEILERRLRSGQAPMGLFKLVKLLGPVARGLTRAHRFPGPTGTTISIVHRDIKPQNLFVANVNGLETVKILDFGIATAIIAAERGAGLSAAKLTDPVRAFTPRYAAPEQWDPDRFGQTGPWTDVWGLAITMVEALAGKPAVDGTHDEMKARVLDAARRPTPRAQGVVIADEIEQAFARALAVEPKARTRYVEAFWVQVETAMGMSSSLKRRDVRRESTGFPPVSGPVSGRTIPREDPEGAGRAAESSRDRSPTSAFSAAPVSAEPGGPRSSEPRDMSAFARPGGPRASEPRDMSAFARPGGPRASEPRDMSAFARPGGARASEPRDMSASAKAAIPPPDDDVELELTPSALPMPPSGGGSVQRGSTPPPAQRPPSVPPAAARQSHSGEGRLSSPGRVSSGGDDGGDPAAGLEASLPEAPVEPSRTTDPPADAASLRASGSFGRASSAGRPSQTALAPRPPQPVPALASAEGGGIVSVLRLPLGMLAVGAVLAVVDVVLASGGSAVMIGPVRLLWIGAVLLVAGTALLFWRLLADEPAG